MFTFSKILKFSHCVKETRVFTWFHGIFTLSTAWITPLFHIMFSLLTFFSRKKTQQLHKMFCVFISFLRLSLQILTKIVGFIDFYFSVIIFKWWWICFKGKDFVNKDEKLIVYNSESCQIVRKCHRRTTSWILRYLKQNLTNFV